MVKRLYDILPGTVVIYEGTDMIVSDDELIIVSLSEDEKHGIGEIVQLEFDEELEVRDRTHIEIREDSITVDNMRFFDCECGDVIVYDNCKMMVMESMFYAVSLEDVDKHYIGEFVSIKSNDQVVVHKGATVEVVAND